MTLDQLLSKAFNGKAENIVISKNIIMFHLDGVETRINLVSFIDQIYNDHEAELQSEYRRLEGRDFMLSEMQKELKAKDEEIKELGEIVQQYLIPSKNYDAIIKAKDDEIRRLNNLYADTIKDLGDALIEIERLKAEVQYYIELEAGEDP